MNTTQRAKDSLNRLRGMQIGQLKYSDLMFISEMDKRSRKASPCFSEEQVARLEELVGNSWQIKLDPPF